MVRPHKVPDKKSVNTVVENLQNAGDDQRQGKQNDRRRYIPLCEVWSLMLF